jgi:hypothetical protein
MGDTRDCDVVIEVTFSTGGNTPLIFPILQAIAENMDLKINFYKNLGGLVKPEAVFASNTSSLPITSMGVASGRPDK